MIRHLKYKAFLSFKFECNRELYDRDAWCDYCYCYNMKICLSFQLKKYIICIQFCSYLTIVLFIFILFLGMPFVITVTYAAIRLNISDDRYYNLL